LNDVEAGLHNFGADAVPVRDCDGYLLAHFWFVLSGYHSGQGWKTLGHE
jgi:hypothetical protein